MALYDDASLIFLASGAAGVEIKDSSKAPCVKPVEQLTGSEKVINGDFDSDSDWTKGTGWSISGGTASCSGDQTGNTGLSQLLSSDRLEDGSTYKITYTISNYVAGQVNPHLRGTATGNTTGNGTRSVYGVAGSNDSYDINFFADSNFNASIDNVSIKKVTTKAADFDISRDANLDATRVGPTGLIEKGRENLMTYSNQFDNAIWVGASTFTIGQQGYDGTNNAWTFAKNSDTGSDFHNDLFNGLITFSIHVKKETGNNKGIAIYAFHGYSDQNSDGVIDAGENVGHDNCFINLETGAVVSTAGSPKHVQVDAVGNDFWRISMTVDRNSHRWFLYTTVSDSLSATSITIQDAQVEVGIAATQYITTGATTATAGLKEDEPRFDYPPLGGAPSLLIEPQRKNYFAFSEYAAGNSLTDSPVLTQNYAVSPEGLQNAFRIQHSGTDFRRVNTPNINITSLGDTFTFSVFVKKASSAVSTYGGFGINFFGTSQKIAYVIFDEFHGTTTKSDAVGNMVVHPTEDYGDYWRFSASYTDTGSNTFVEGILYAMISTNGSSVTVTAGGSKDYTAYGMQFEEGASPTSYIPTHGTAATRSADTIAALTSIPSVNTSTYTFFAHVSQANTGGTGNRGPRMQNASNDALMGYFINNSDQKTFFLDPDSAGGGSNRTFNTTDIDSATGGTQLAGDEVKYAFVINGTSVKCFVNGTTLFSGTASGVVTANRIIFATSDGSPEHIKSVIYFPSAISDANAISLTTL